MPVPSIVNPRPQCFAWADPSSVSALACGPAVPHHLFKRAAVFVEIERQGPASPDDEKMISMAMTSELFHCREHHLALAIPTLAS
jgi:hypothetical protein